MIIFSWEFEFKRFLNGRNASNLIILQKDMSVRFCIEVNRQKEEEEYEIFEKKALVNLRKYY